jgi:hypothetical protein
VEVPEERVPHGGRVPAPGRAGQQREQRTEGRRQVGHNVAPERIRNLSRSLRAVNPPNSLCRKYGKLVTPFFSSNAFVV